VLGSGLLVSALFGHGVRGLAGNSMESLTEDAVEERAASSVV
jgi:hypothetical protein